jgi:hypothetical protein
MKRILWTTTLATLALAAFAGCTRNALQRKTAAPDPLLLSKSLGEGKTSTGVPTSYKPRAR